MPPKFLIHRADKGADSSSPAIFFTNAKMASLTPGHQATVWFFDHASRQVHPQHADLLICQDGILRGGKMNRHYRTYHRVVRLPPAFNEIGGMATYNRWLSENDTWQPPTSLEVGEEIHLNTPEDRSHATLRTINASDAQLEKLDDHVHFTSGGMAIPPVSLDDYLLTRQGSFWQRVEGIGFEKLNKPVLTFPPPLRPPRKR